MNGIDEINLIAVSIAVIGCIIALTVDLKEKKIPNGITFTMLGLSVPLALLRSYFGGSDFLLLWGANFILSLVLAYALWNVRAWAGGDGKIFWAVIALIPVNPGTAAGILPQPPYLYFTFIITFFLNLGMVLLLKFFFTALFESLRKKKANEFIKTAGTPILFVVSAVSFASGLAAITGEAFLAYASFVVILLFAWSGRKRYSYTAALALLLLFLGCIMCDVTTIGSFATFIEARSTAIFFVFLFTAYALGAKDNRVMNVRIDDLEEGMPLAEKIYLRQGAIIRERTDNKGVIETVKSWIGKVKDKNAGDNIYVIAAPSPQGLGKEDIKRLKKYMRGLDSVSVHATVELMPFIATALLISLLIGDPMGAFIYRGI